jgi:ParB-like chromosome segregation protein Spo0J
MLKKAAPGDLCERYRELRLERPSEVARLSRSMAREGVLHALVVNEEADGKLAVLDGFKRLSAARGLSLEELPVRAVRLDESRARASVLAYNRGQRGMSELEEAWVVRSLVRGCGLRQLDVAKLLGRHKSWVTRRLRLCERLTDELQDDMRLGLLCATAARELSRLPRGNQERLGAVVKKEGLTSRECSLLVEKLLRCPDAESVDAVLSEPHRFLKAEPEAKTEPARDPRLGDGAEEVRQWLVRLDDTASGLVRVLRRHRPASLSNDEQQRLFARAHRTQQRVDEAQTELSELVRVCLDA